MAGGCGKKFGKFSGFTLLELLMTMSIMVFIAATLVIYSHIGEKQITLFKEQARVLNTLARARNLGITSFIKSDSSGPLPCGYGVHFEMPGTMVIFQDTATDPECVLADHIYLGDESEKFESIVLSTDVSFDFLSLSDVVFVPPQPLVFITPQQDDALITLTTGGNDPVMASVKVSTANQISVQ